MKTRRPTAAQTNGTTPIKGAMLSVVQAAMLLGQDTRWVRRRMKDGIIPYHKLNPEPNGHVVILRAELEQFIADLATLPGISVDQAKKNLRLRSGDKGQR